MGELFRTLNIGDNPETFFEKDLIGRVLSFNSGEVHLDRYIGAGAMAGIMGGMFIETSKIDDWALELKEKNHNLEADEAVKQATEMLTRYVAVKILNPFLSAGSSKDSKEKSPSAILEERFIDEAKILIDLSDPEPHPNIINIQGYGWDNDTGLPFILLDYFENPVDLQNKNILVGLENICEIAAKAGRGLSHAHKRLKQHRDVKPENILARKENGVWNVKVIDWGVAKKDNLGRTRTDEVIGTPYFIPPEIVHGRAGTDEDKISTHSDLYSLGATLYYLATGKTPYDADTIPELFRKIIDKKRQPVPPMEINRMIPRELNELILWSIAKDPAERPRNMDEFVEVIESLRKRTVSLESISSIKQSRSKEGTKKTQRIVPTTALAEFIGGLEKKKGEFSLLEQISATSKKREFIDECWDEERTELEKKGLDVSTRNFKVRDKENLAKRIERWLEITDRDYYTEKFKEKEKGLAGRLLIVFGIGQSEHIILTRKRRLNALKNLYADLADVNENYEDKLKSIQRKIAWEENRQNHLGVKTPKTLWEEYGGYITKIGAAATILLLGGHMVGNFITGHLRQLRNNEAAQELKITIEEMMAGKAVDYKDLDGKILRLRELYNQGNQSELMVVADGLRDRLRDREKKEEEEKRLRNLYTLEKKKVDDAYQLFEESKKEKDFEGKKKKLFSLVSLLDSVELRILSREHADELRQRIDSLDSEIGPQKVAFKEYVESVEKSKEIEEKKTEWEALLEKGGYFEMNPLLTLKDKIVRSYVMLKTESTRKYFSGDTTYDDWLNKLKDMEKDLLMFERRLSTARFTAARNLLPGLESTLSWLAKNYFLPEAEKRKKEAETLIFNIQGHLDNTNRIYLIFGGGLELFDTGWATASKNFSAASEKIKETEELRKKAETDNAAALEMGRLLLFEGQCYDLARPYFEKTGDEGKSYLRIAGAMERVNDAKYHLQLRDGLLSSEVDKYSRLVQFFGNDPAKTPSYQLSEVYDWFDWFESFEGIKGTVEKTRAGMAELEKLAGDAGKPDNEEYAKRLEEFSKKAREFSGLAELEKALRGYLAEGTKITDPYAIWSLGSAMADVGRTEDARKYYNACLASPLLNKDEKKLIKEEIENLGD